MTSNLFKPAKLVKGKTRWYILYYQTPPGETEQKRFRETHDLNRITNLIERERHGLFIAKVLNDRLLKEGYPYRDQKFIDAVFKEALNPNAKAKKTETSLKDAINYAKDIKCTSDRELSNKVYRSISKIFLKWANSLGLEDMNTREFGPEYAIRFMDYCLLARKICNTTYNNYLTHIRRLFKELVLRGVVNDNPFEKIECRRPSPKKRRNLLPEEQKIIMTAMKENDSIWLFRAFLLTYMCFIRGAELRRLKFSNFNLVEGTIVLQASITKSKYPRTVTIPRQILPYFLNKEFTKYPANHLVFGKGLEPHPSKDCGEKAMNSRHRRILKDLQRRGLLYDITGITWYSWKDTGITDTTDTVNIKDVQMQAGHKSIEETMKYIHPHKINQGMKNYRSPLFES